MRIKYVRQGNATAQPQHAPARFPASGNSLVGDALDLGNMVAGVLAPGNVHIQLAGEVDGHAVHGRPLRQVGHAEWQERLLPVASQQNLLLAIAALQVGVGDAHNHHIRVVDGTHNLVVKPVAAAVCSRRGAV